MGEINRLGIDTERDAGGRFRRHPATPSVIDYPGRRGPGRTSFPPAGGGQGYTPTMAEVGRTAPEQLGERSTATWAAGRSGVAPESVGTKRAAPEEGSLGRPVKRSQVRSKM
jgi:hypothetical protein